jgi:hypothetical protein
MRGIIHRTILTAALAATVSSIPASSSDSTIDTTVTRRDGAAAADLEQVSKSEDPTASRGRAHRLATPLGTLLTELAPWRRAGKLLGLREQRKLAAASAQIELQSKFQRNPESDPDYGESRSQVRGSYLKLYRDMLREDFIDDWIEDSFAARHHGRDGAKSQDGDETSWHVRVVPRLSLGSHGFVGAKLSLPEVGVKSLDHMSLGVRRGFAADEWGVSLRYSDGPRFLQLERLDGGHDGRRYAATLAFRF